MPEISRFYGIVIRMYFADHNPPHFHAFYGDHQAEIHIFTFEIIRGALPRQAYKLVVKWALLHRQELEENWEKTSNLELPKHIRPLE